MSDSVVIIPTYNEKENIEKIIRAVFGLEKDFDILVIDDGSEPLEFNEETGIRATLNNLFSKIKGTKLWTIVQEIVIAVKNKIKYSQSKLREYISNKESVNKFLRLRKATEKEKLFQDLGVTLTNPDGTFRSTKEVLEDLSKSWDKTNGPK